MIPHDWANDGTYGGWDVMWGGWSLICRSSNVNYNWSEVAGVAGDEDEDVQRASRRREGWERERQRLPWRLQAPFKKQSPGGLRFNIKPISPPSLSPPLVSPFSKFLFILIAKRELLNSCKQEPRIKQHMDKLLFRIHSEVTEGCGLFTFICAHWNSPYISESENVCTNALGCCFVLSSGLV